MNEGAKVILIDDDDDLRHALVQGLELEDIPVSAYSQPERALEGIDRTFAAGGPNRRRSFIGFMG